MLAVSNNASNWSREYLDQCVFNVNHKSADVRQEPRSNVNGIWNLSGARAKNRDGSYRERSLFLAKRVNGRGERVGSYSQC